MRFATWLWTLLVCARLLWSWILYLFLPWLHPGWVARLWAPTDSHIIYIYCTCFHLNAEMYIEQMQRQDWDCVAGILLALSHLLAVIPANERDWGRERQRKTESETEREREREREREMWMGLTQRDFCFAPWGDVAYFSVAPQGIRWQPGQQGLSCPPCESVRAWTTWPIALVVRVQWNSICACSCTSSTRCQAFLT